MKHKGQSVAYLRVSSVSQKTDRQSDLREDADRVFEEKASAGTRNRPVLEEMLTYVREGDEVNVWSMDRLARSLQDLRAIVEELTGKGVAVHFRKENLSFVPGANDPYAKLTLQLLGAVAEFERDIIRARQAEGIAKAKARGAYKGRAKKLTSVQVAEAQERIALGVPKAQVARDLAVSRSTLYKALKEADQP